MALQFWYPDDVKNIAEALIATNDDTNYRHGVAALAHALGAKLQLIRLIADNSRQLPSANGWSPPDTYIQKTA